MRVSVYLGILLCVGLFLSFGDCKKRGKSDKKSKKRSKSLLSPDSWPESLGAKPNITRLVQENRHRLRKLGRYEIVFPVQHRKSKQSRVDTRDVRKGPGAHFSHTSIVLSIAGEPYKIKLSLNKNLLGESFIQKHYLTDDTQVISKSVEHCYYHGRIKKLPGALIAVSTCNGVNGVIQLDNDTYIIQPLITKQVGTLQAHVISKTAPSRDKSCGNQSGQWQSYQQLHLGEFLQRRKMMSLREKRNVMAEMKYIELALVFDYSMYLQKNSSLSKINSYALQIANIVDMYYKQLNTRVALVFVEVWNEGDPMRVSSNARETLHSFLQIKNIRLKNIQHDVAHLITARTFENDQMGMAVPDSVCSERAVAVNEDPSPNEPHKIASIVTHMIGHNIGLLHDEKSEACSCDHSPGCFMAEDIFGFDGQTPQSFSECSIKNYHLALGTGLGYCLFNDPDPSAYYQQHCGNNKVERGEECDCGPASKCDHDPCCDARTCLLKPWAKCTTGPCCKNCTVLSSRHQCRESVSQCDVPEFCDGISGQCPQNAFVQNGQPCLGAAGYCYQGRCPVINDQCKAIWGSDAEAANELCYVTFNPTGNLMGHCGKDSSDKYVPCEDEHVKCGLLHCSGGSSTPLQGADQLPHTKLTHSSAGVMFECKIANGQTSRDVMETGMVLDGTRCGSDHMCLNQACVNVALVFDGDTCPKGGPWNTTCSGHGVCTTMSACFCEQYWEGTDCSVKRNITTTTVRSPPVVQPKSERPVIISSPLPTTANVSAIVDPLTEGLGTMWLVIILASVIGIVVVVLAFTMLCYRRKSPVRTSSPFKKVTSKKKLPSKEESSEDGTVRSIKFEKNMPSYRKDKINGRAKSKNKPPHKQSQSDSDDEAKTNHTVPEIDTRPEVKIPEELSRVPERGILKNSSHNYDDSEGECSCSDEHDGISELDEVPDIEIRKDFGKRSVNGSTENVGTPTYQHFKDYSPYGSREELPPGVSDYVNNRALNGSDGMSSPVQMSVVKLRSIDDLITKIDSQSLPADAISPANSDEMKYSETEVDHHYHKAQTYPRQPLVDQHVHDSVDSANESGFDTGCEQNTVLSADDTHADYPVPMNHSANSSFKPYHRDDAYRGVSPTKYANVPVDNAYHELRRRSKSPDDFAQIKRPQSPARYSSNDDSDDVRFKPTANSQLFPSRSFRPQPRSSVFSDGDNSPMKRDKSPVKSLPANGDYTFARSSEDEEARSSEREVGGYRQPTHLDSLKMVRSRNPRRDTSPHGLGSDGEDHVRRNSYIMATDGAIEV